MDILVSKTDPPKLTEEQRHYYIDFILTKSIEQGSIKESEYQENYDKFNLAEDETERDAIIITCWAFWQIDKDKKD